MLLNGVPASDLPLPGFCCQKTEWKQNGRFQRGREKKREKKGRKNTAHVSPVELCCGVVLLNILIAFLFIFISHFFPFPAHASYRGPIFPKAFTYLITGERDKIATMLQSLPASFCRLVVVLLLLLVFMARAKMGRYSCSLAVTWSPNCAEPLEVSFMDGTRCHPAFLDSSVFRCRYIFCLRNRRCRSILFIKTSS